MTHSEIAGLWPTHAAFARDIGAGYENAKKMRMDPSRRISPEFWPALLAAAERRGFTVTVDMLVAGAAKHAA